MSTPQRFRLLIAEDDPGLRAVLRLIFEPFFELLEAANGGEAVDIIRGERVDVAVFDFRMPRRTGLEAFAELRSVNEQAPGILVTAEADSVREDAERLEVYAVLAKPVARRELLHSVDAAMRSVYHQSLLPAA